MFAKPMKRGKTSKKPNRARQTCVLTIWRYMAKTDEWIEHVSYRVFCQISPDRKYITVHRDYDLPRKFYRSSGTPVNGSDHANPNYTLSIDPDSIRTNS